MKRPWVVLKFGGTSVSTAGAWAQIARRAAALLPTHRVWIVASALTEVSNRLEAALEQATGRGAPDALDWVRQRHRALAREIGLDERAAAPVERALDDLARLLEGVRLTGESSPRVAARVLAYGEMASTHVGVAALRVHGLEVLWLDARDLLESAFRPHQAEAARFLDAEVEARHDPGRAEAAARGADLVLTQGFVARTPRGDTCLLGRGGSDTSGALFAAMLGAEWLEIWSDVHGLFTADPRHAPTARLIRRIGYREAQELAAMGAKVLHPRCLGPVAAAGIPLLLRNTFDPDAEGTCIGAPRDDTEEAPAVMAVVRRTGVTLLSLSTVEMWGAAGFLARSFAPFEETGISVDLVATSQSTVSMTLDRIPGGIEGEPFASLLRRLQALGRVEIVHPCAVVSIVGRRIRTVLHELGPALAAFQERAVHLVSESSDDLNISFVVDEDDADPLVQQLHARLVPAQGDDARFGPTWELLQQHAIGSAGGSRGDDTADHWWRRRHAELLRLASDGVPRFVYDLGTVAERAGTLRARLGSVRRFFYAMKANANARVLETLAEAGFGMECVSPGEILRAREVLGAAVPILFTPNFCPPGEYALALDHGAMVTVDGPHVFDVAPGLFRGQEVMARADPGRGLGHNEKVRTAGPQAKFGHPASEMETLAAAASRGGIRVVGLHAHVGSGILDPTAWAHTGAALAALRPLFPDLAVVNVGGGLGVAERPGQTPLDLDRVEAALARLAEALAGLALWMEPGRYLVSDAGVLLAQVTQVRVKAGVRFVGVATGMNSLLRPALYGAWHGIHDLTRLGEAGAGYAHVVGPICETADVLGRDRLLPDCAPGDVLLIENCGAYGAVMSSRYNLRDPAIEEVL